MFTDGIPPTSLRLIDNTTTARGVVIATYQTLGNERRTDRSPYRPRSRRESSIDGLVGEEAAPVQRPHLAYRDESLALEEGDAGAGVALVG